MSLSKELLEGVYTPHVDEQQLGETDEHDVFSTKASAMNVSLGPTDGNISCTPKAGVGRGSLLTSMLELSEQAPPIDDYREKPGRSSSHTTFNEKRDQNATGGEQENQWQLMADFAKQLGSEIGTQIASSISSAAHNSPNMNASIPQLSAQTPEWSKLNLVLKSDIREPPPFRGDSTDRCSVTDWQELMQVYLNRKGCTVSEQGPGILDRLLGRAKDVVKIGIRNNPLINISRDPDVIFTILRQHFGEAISSTTPLKDFYETLPRQSETGLDYWIRLNKSVRHVLSTFLHLKKQQTEAFSSHLLLCQPY